MEESKEQQKLYGFFQMLVYFIVILDIIIFLYRYTSIFGSLTIVFDKLATTPMFSNPLYTKLLTLLIICITGIGTKSKKKLDLDPAKEIAVPIAFGLLILFASVICLKEGKHYSGKDLLPYTNLWDLGYIISSFLGAILTLTGIDNISKIIKSNFGKDEWNVEGESFQQQEELLETPTSVNIPMQFYYKGRVLDGYINIDPFRGTLIMGAPGTGKSFGIINPFIRQTIGKGFTGVIYDFKFPDLTKIAYYRYLLAKQAGTIPNHSFKVINVDDVTRSYRVNPLNPKYVQTLSQAQEIAGTLVEALKKGDKAGGADLFFTQSAINFLAAAIYFLAKYKNGRYSSLPYLLSFLNLGYDDIFSTLFIEPELKSLLAPFQSAHEKKAYDQLEGQIGTLRVFTAKLASKESYWVFTEDPNKPVNLAISNPEDPTIIILANSPSTQENNSALYALVVNRIVSLVNTKANLPTAIIADEAPTLYIHKIDNLIATARSNRVAVLLGIQEIPQFNAQYGKETAAKIISTINNVLAGAVRNQETLNWLQTILGKKKQAGEGLNIDRTKTSVNLNEKLDYLVPAGKIAGMNTGEIVGLIARDAKKEFEIKYLSSAVNCKINLDMDEIREEQNNYREVPIIYNFNGDQDKILLNHFLKINQEILDLVDEVKSELAS